MQTLSQVVTETLREWILHGKFSPGMRIEEIPVAEMMKVSRTPVRAALATLSSDGLLDYQPKRGYTVRVFALDEIMAAYEVRSVLEGLACRKAAERGLTPAQTATLAAALALGDEILGKGRLDPQDHAPYQQLNIDIHNTILAASSNAWVSRFAAQAHHIPYASDRIMLWESHQVIWRSHDDHHRIVRALRSRDGRRAEELMREHVYYAGVILRDNYSKLLEKQAAAE